MELENAAVESVEVETDQEVAEPDESPEEGSNYQEVAEPESEEVAEQSHEDNAKFQEFRHQNEELQRKNEELQKRIEEMEANEKVRNEVYSEYIDDDSDLEDILADALGISSDELSDRIEQRTEIEKLRSDLAMYQQREQEALKREQEARENEELTNQLARVHKIDPSINSVEDFEKKFQGLSHTPIGYLEKGFTLEEAYWSLEAERKAYERTPPPEAGGVKSEQTEKPYVTKEEAFAMTPEERAKNWKLIRESQQRW